MQLKDVIGQQKIKKQLIKTVKEGRISHTQLFLGHEGSGNLALAIAYAQYICCTNKENGDSCNSCPSCTKYQKRAEEVRRLTPFFVLLFHLAYL